VVRQLETPFVCDEIRSKEMLVVFLTRRADGILPYVAQAVPVDHRDLRVGMIVIDNENDVGTVIRIEDKKTWVRYDHFAHHRSQEHNPHDNPFGWSHGRAGVTFEAIPAPLIEEQF
jgi:hypothetical protein